MVLARKERDRMRRKADILNAAEHVFALKGYDKATMQDIAKKAEYAIGTVYLYFKDKNALYFSLLEEKMRDMLTSLKEKTAKVSDARERLETCLKEKLAFFEANQDFFKIYISESRESECSIEQKMQKTSFVEDYLRFMAGLMRAAQKQSVIRKDVDPDLAADVFLSIFKLIIVRCFREGLQSTQDLKGLCSLIMGIFLNGMGQKNEN